MNMKNRILILLALLLVLNTGVVFAATGDASYDAGYSAGYDAGAENARNDVDPEDILNDFTRTTKFRSIRDSIDNFNYNAFDQGFIDGFEDGVKDNTKENYSDTLGQLLGEIHGARDYQNGKRSNWGNALPSDREIRNMFDLSIQDSDYREVFIEAFKVAFKDAYIEAFEKAMFDSEVFILENAFANGEEIGKSRGEMEATVDFMSNNPNNWRKNIPDERYIISEYNLRLQTPRYRDAFIVGFLTGYTEGYITKYIELSQDLGVNKNVSARVPIAGTSLNSLDNILTVTIEAGTYYHPVNLSINTTYDASVPVFNRLIKASDTYSVSILNTSNNFDDNKPIKLSFEYYGDKTKGGIYKLVDNRWLYIPSVIEDGVIYTLVKPSSIKSSGSTYSVFLDKEFILFPDARGHWAKDEINTYVRRGIIYGYSDMTFKPDRNITRAEFLTLLSRVYNWNTPIYTVNTTVFKDYNDFGNRNGIISYALSSEYIKGYGDGTFKPNNPISYNEIEIIMGRVLGNPNFKWSIIANDILYNKKVRSNSYNDINNKITRAEVVYMLYTTTESMN